MSTKITRATSIGTLQSMLVDICHLTRGIPPSLRLCKDGSGCWSVGAEDYPFETLDDAGEVFAGLLEPVLPDECPWCGGRLVARFYWDWWVECMGDCRMEGPRAERLGEAVTAFLPIYEQVINAIKPEGGR